MSSVKESKKCLNCNKPIKKENTIYGERDFNRKKYCSLKCNDSYNSKIKHTNKIQYLTDNNCKCQICDYDEFPILQIHHIQERHNGGNNNPNNLIVVCPNCHRKIHKHFIYLDIRRMDKD